MSEYEKTNVPNMVIDKATNTIINTDMGAYQAIKNAREERRKHINLAERVSALELEVKNLRAMLGQDNRD